MVPSILRFHSQASHQQNFCSRSIWAGSANIYKIAKTSGDQHRHNLCKCRHSPHLLTGLQPQSREALVCGIQGPSGDKETIKIFTSGLQLIILVVFLFLKNNPYSVSSLCRWHELARSHLSRRKPSTWPISRSGSDVDISRRRSFFWLLNLSWRGT